MTESIVAVPLLWTELRGWYFFDVASSAQQQIAASFLPILLQSVASEKAGFPEICENEITNYTLSQEIFGENMTMYVNGAALPCSGCVSYTSNDTITDFPFANETLTYCPGELRTPALCLDGLGQNQIRLSNSFFGYEMDPNEYVLLFTSFSVLLQAFCYVSFGAVGDYSTNRKFYFVLTGTLGAVFTICTVAVTPDLWWVGGVFMILMDLGLGTSTLLYNAWLPLLVREHEDVLNAAPEEKDAIIRDKTDKFSTHGFAWGYVGGFISLLCTLPMILFLPEPIGYQVSIVFAGVWWLLFELNSFWTLKSRPGPQVPKGVNSLIIFSWQRTYRTVAKLKKLPNLAKFLALWFFYADGMTTLQAIAALAMNDMITWCYMPKAIGIYVSFLATPIFAMVGSYTARKLQANYKLDSRQIVMLYLAIASLIPAYGLIGFSGVFGLIYGFEIVLAAVIFGFCMGVYQSYSRSVMAQLIPDGYESQFFGIYAITDKGSSWIGPLIASQIVKQTGDLRYTLFLVLMLLAVPAVLLHFVDLEKGIQEAVKFAKEHPANTEEDNDDAHILKQEMLEKPFGGGDDDSDDDEAYSDRAELLPMA
eukprot:m.160996 g.160996  ORF g.160996 m.160996 type:complete len:592 (+) comp31208_c1_seq9:251-2026(+)